MELGEFRHVARVVEVDELLQALDVAVVEEPLLEKPGLPPWRLGGRALCRRHVRIARGRDLELAIGRRGQPDPFRVRVGCGTKAASEESPQSQISVAETEGIRGE